MNRALEALEEWGCDITGALERVCNDEDFFLTCLREVTEDPDFELLKAKLDTGDIPGAFDAAHSLKGVLGTVGLTPMYNKISEIVEPLRAGSTEDMSAQYAQLIEMKQHLTNTLR